MVQSCLERGGAKTGLLHIGFGNIGIFDKRYSRTVIKIQGTIILNGKVFLGHGAKVSVGENGTLTFGNMFINTAEGTIICHNQITFGDEVLTSWNTTIMDTDFHHTVNCKTLQESTLSKPVQVGNKVWIGMESKILKGCYIADGCIVGAGSVCNKKFEQNNCLLAGNPAKVRKNDITRC